MGGGGSLSSEGLISGRNFAFQNGLGLMFLFVLIIFELILDGFFEVLEEFRNPRWRTIWPPFRNDWNRQQLRVAVTCPNFTVN